jgi:glycosyltransferase involved in cell wall biosynthesis
MTFPPRQSNICIIPRVSAFGGPGSFSAGLIQGLTREGIATTHNLSDPSITAVLVIGGTHHLSGLLQARLQGKRIVQRLNGMNWMHRAALGGSKRPRGSIRYFIRSEINNMLLASIRRWVATSIVYQSQFSRDWWNRVYGEVKTESRVIYNAVDLEQFTPAGPADRPQNTCRILLVEGNISGGYQMGLENAIALTEQLQTAHHLSVELKVIGNVPETIQSLWANRKISISWDGIIQRDQIPFSDRSAHLLFSADMNAACPNSVIEAMACGLPVLSFDTGALKELVQEKAGTVVPYGADYWKLEPPQIAPLVNGAINIIEEQSTYRSAARARAVSAFGLDGMVSAYKKSLCG